MVSLQGKHRVSCAAPSRRHPGAGGTPAASCLLHGAPGESPSAVPASSWGPVLDEYAGLRVKKQWRIPGRPQVGLPRPGLPASLCPPSSCHLGATLGTPEEPRALENTE